MANAHPVGMNTLLNVLIGLAMASVAVILITGVVTFMRGGDVNRRNSLKLLNLRVTAQAAALVLFVLAFLVARGSG